MKKNKTQQNPNIQSLPKPSFHYLLLLSSLQPSEAQNRQLRHFNNKGEAGKQMKHPAEEYPSGKH